MTFASDRKGGEASESMMEARSTMQRRPIDGARLQSETVYDTRARRDY